jgi:hypothetical protein
MADFLLTLSQVGLTAEVQKGRSPCVCVIPAIIVTGYLYMV